MNKFSSWLLQELEKNEMSQSQLARATGLTRQAISYYLGEKSKRPDDEALNKIARAFKLPAHVVFRAAGILPAENDNDPWSTEMAHRLRMLNPAMRDVAERLLNTLIEKEQEEEVKKAKLKTIS